MNREGKEGIHGLDTREDGRQRVSFRPFPTPPLAINEISIDAPSNEPGLYRGLGFLGLFVLMPLGRDLAANLDHGGTIENMGSRQSPRWKLTAARESERVECELDASHQFLPRVVTLSRHGRTYLIQVERFEQVNGFFYPAEGSAIYLATDKYPQIEVRFRLDQVKFNQVIPDSRFQWTTFPTGAQVVNKIDRKTYSVGGRRARLQLLGEHPIKQEKPPIGSPITVPPDHDAASRWWFVVIALTVAALTGFVSVILRIRSA